ncbi:NAD(P)-dependent oxidoreductase [Plantactinospora sp. KLBMP9567]|uniref:NAD(P)-dependent oxidoreductase n=1 Tax=Plantactinospora sp. KLBMP9567 TaxID=3085900 RepID=UPI0029815D91|nr:NAD(P)H-binding protein [Plantactinospora sp. KLBMP9567]MDW5323299.1 NAD(P)H-binding protein [Plantactinospora sp. KLBMP9567]
MKLTVFAASGGIGRHLLRQAVAAGHDVTAVVRSPASLAGESDGIRVVTVDLSNPDPAVLADAVDKADGVLSGLGPRSMADSGVASRGTREIVTAMRARGVPRLVVVSAAPLSTIAAPGRPKPPPDPGEGPLLRYLLGPIIKTVLRKHYLDLAVMEELLRDSDLDWTVVRPPRLTDKPLTGVYRTAYGRSVRGGMVVPRADVAHCMLRALEQPETIRQAVAVAT